jgi:hypothetical protein
MLTDISNTGSTRPAAGAPTPGRRGVSPLVSPGAGVDFRDRLWRNDQAAAAAPAAQIAPASAPAQAVAIAEPARPPGGFLAELEQEVRRSRDPVDRPEEPDLSALARNTRLANAACRAVLDYWTLFAEHLNALTMAIPGRYAFDGRTALEGGPGQAFRVASNLRTTHGGSEQFESVLLTWRVGRGERLKLHKVFPVEIERLRTRLRFAGINAAERQVHDPVSGHPRGTEFEFVADVNASVRIVPLHDAGKVRLTLLNLAALERIQAELPAFAMRPAELDELARLICGRPSSLLKHAQNIVRQEP